MANLLSLILPLVFTFAVAVWGPLSVKHKPPTTNFPGADAHRSATRQTREE